MSGPTGPITHSEFRELIEYDEVLAYRVKNPFYFSTREETVVIHFHYFKNGVEVGDWTPITGLGFIFETPRSWCEQFKLELTPA